MSDSKSVAVIGLGSMGYGVAQSCIRAGLTTYGHDVAPGPVDRLRAEGGAAGTLAEAAGSLDAVVVVVLNAAQTEAVLFGPDGVVPRLRPGAVVLGCATVAPDFARAMAERCAGHGVLFLDAPISGGAARAAQGTLSVLASGTAEAFAAARPVLDAMAETVFELGEAAGAGSAMKAVNQLLAGVHIAAMAEAMALGMTQGIAPKTFLDVIRHCAGTSWMLENRAPHVIDGDYSPKSQIAIWPKDLGLVLDIARSASFGAPLAAAAMQQYLAAAGMGLAREDDAAVIKVYARNAGLTLPGETE
ncbi:MAG: NAD(P)-dependent oxidoreductase [Roseivivax sp.]|nr:NAD(P)-dependent oxidoreductase [Roseivivax sp.]